MSFRKRKGDAAEAVRQRFWEAQGALVFPVSPSFAGVDLVVFHPDGRIILSEVKGQREPLYGATKALAVRKVDAFAQAARLQMAECDGFGRGFHSVEGELVHVRKDGTEVLWRDPK